MKKISLIALIAVIGLVYQNCSKSSFQAPQIVVAEDETNGSTGTGGSNTNTGGTNTTSQKVIHILHYFRGGWMPAPGSSSFSHDGIFNFLNSQKAYVQYNKTNQASACKGEKTLSATQISNILSKINSATALMTQKSPDDPMRADGGTEFVDMSFSDSSKLKAYIDGAEAPAGSYLIVNPEAGKSLSDYLKSIVDSQETLANSNCVGFANTFKSVRYFKSQYTTWTEGNMQYKGVKTLKNYTLDLAQGKVILGTEMVPTGSSCSATVTRTAWDQILDGVEALQISKKSNTVNYVPEEGYEYVEIVYSDDSKKVIHLKATNAEPGSNLASSAELSSLLSSNPSSLSCVK